MCLDTPGSGFSICCGLRFARLVILSLFEGNVYMKRFAAFVLTLCVAVCMAMPAAAVGYDPSTVYTVQADCAYVVNTDTNIIIYEKNSEQPVQANSLTQLMTVALALTNYGDALDTTTVTQPQAISDYVYGTKEHADVRIGETLTLRQALYAIMVSNANEVTMTTAYCLSGNDLTGWVSQMNSLSRKIGTTGSVWTDACGIDDGNTTTARDMYLILRYLMSFDAFVEIAGSYSFEMPANSRHASSYGLYSYNKMLSKSAGGKFYRASVQGGKVDLPGYSGENHGKQSAVSWTTQNGESYIFSVMGSPDSCDTYGYGTRRPALYETNQLIDWVYASFAVQPALDTDQPICEVSVKYSSGTDRLKLYPADDMMTILPSTSDSTVTQKLFNLPEAVYAPVKQGDVVGSVTLLLAGEEIGRVDLLAGQDVDRNPVLFTVAKLQDFFGSLYFKVVLVVTVLTVAAYVGWAVVDGIRQRNSKKIQRW